MYVVNKADRDGADQVARDLQVHAVARRPAQHAGAWRPLIVKTVASRSEGIDDVVAAIDKHRDWMEHHDELAHRRRARAATEIESIAVGEVRQRFAAGARLGCAGRRRATCGRRRHRPVRRGRRPDRPALTASPRGSRASPARSRTRTTSSPWLPCRSRARDRGRVTCRGDARDAVDGRRRPGATTAPAAAHPAGSCRGGAACRRSATAQTRAKCQRRTSRTR